MATPRIGRYWDGHGGIYAGIYPAKNCDNHLILSVAAHKRDVIWIEAKLWSKGVRCEGFTDFKLPSRRQSALLYATLQSYFPDLWFWTSETYHADKLCAWVQTFGYGRQADARKTDACRACAVRTEPVLQIDADTAYDAAIAGEEA